MSQLHSPLLFCLDASRPFGEAVAARLDWPLSEHEEREFDSGEHKARPLVEVSGRDVFVIHSLDGEAEQSANDKLIRLLFFIGALKSAGAGRVTAVTPYLSYARKDRRTKPRDPVNMRHVAQLFEAMGTDCLLTLEIHNVAAFENAFRACRAENLPSAGLLAAHVAPLLADDPVSVVSPDSGGAKRAELFRTALEQRLGRAVDKALIEKHRSGGVLSGSLFAGDVKGRTAIILDDLISSGGTIIRAARRCREQGAGRVMAAAAHGLFTDGAPELFGEDGPDMILATDSVATRHVANPDLLQIVSAAGLFASAIDCLHGGGALYNLIPYD